MEDCASIKAGDRALALLSAWGVSVLGIAAFLQLWVKHHNAQYLELRETWPYHIVVYLFATVCLLVGPAGVVLAWRARRQAIVRAAAVVGAVGYAAIVLANLLPEPIQRLPHPLFLVLSGIPLAAGLALLALGAVWLARRRAALRRS